ncbi:hypothetical protein BJD16_08950 [Aeromonas sobria]|uniref:Uncharacterized protein n=2 Tax=Aeromonas sobria TaxID=646 RepID=A0A1S2D5E6_AERSO|nr:hypothetical protein BJD16_08950 [Aeromonas sobria]
MEFKKNELGEYHSSYAICFDEIISIKDGQKLPALKLVSLNNVQISDYRDIMITQGEYYSDKKTFSDLVLFDVPLNESKQTSAGDNIFCNYYTKDYNFGVSTDNIRCYRPSHVKGKAYLYNAADAESETKKYLVPGDKVIPLDEKMDRKNNNWTYVLYQGKKDTKMWINSKALDLDKHVK